MQIRMGVSSPRERAKRDNSLLPTENNGIVNVGGDAPDSPASEKRLRQDQPEAAAEVSEQVHGSRLCAAGQGRRGTSTAERAGDQVHSEAGMEGIRQRGIPTS